MNDEQILTEIKKLVKRAGSAQVLSALTGKGVGATTAERIVNGRYANKPNGLLKQTLLDLLEQNKAS